MKPIRSLGAVTSALAAIFFVLAPIPDRITRLGIRPLLVLASILLFVIAAPRWKSWNRAPAAARKLLAQARETGPHTPSQALLLAFRLGAYMHPFALVGIILGPPIAFAGIHNGNFFLWWIGSHLLVFGLCVEPLVVWNGLYQKKYLPALRHLQGHPWNNDLAEYRSHSLCERRMLRIACKATGHAVACEEFLSRAPVYLSWWKWASKGKESIRNLKSRKSNRP